MANDFLIELTGGLDETASKSKLNSDISSLQGKLEKVKLEAEIDPQKISDIEKQLKNLKATISDVAVDQKAINTIVAQINNALKGIQISNINFNQSGFRQQGQQAGKLLSKGVEDALKSISSPEIGVKFDVDEKSSSDFENAVNKEIEALQKKSNTAITVSYKTDIVDEQGTDEFGNEITQKVEKLTGAVFKYTTATGEAITKTMKWAQIDIGEDDKPIMGWVQGLTTYTKSLDQASTKTNNFAKQQKKAVADVTNQIKQMNASAIDPNASRTITDATHLSTLKIKYDEIVTAIQKMETASADTFIDEQNNVKALIAEYKILVSQYRNAENVRTAIKPDKIKDSSSKVTSQFKALQSNITAANVPLGSMEDNLKSIQTVVDKIENKEVVSKAELENTLTLLQNCRDELSALKTQKANATALEKLKVDAETVKNSIASFSKDNTGFDAFKTTINGVEVSVESLINALSGVNTSTDLSLIRSKFEALKSVFNNTKSIQIKIDSGAYESKVAELTAKAQQWTDANGKTRVSITELKSAYQALDASKTDADKIVAAERLDKAIQEITNSIRTMNATYAKDSQISSVHQKIQEFYDKNSAAHKQWGAELKSMLSQTADGAELTKVQLSKIDDEFINIKNAARQAGKLGLSFFDGVKEQASKFAQWFSITSVITAGISEIKQMTNAVIECDSAMVELAKVSDASSNELAEYFDKAAISAKNLGAKVSDVISATADFSRLGYNLEDSSKLAEVATLYKNVGDGIDIGTASSSIVSTMKAFGIEAKNTMGIIDRFNEVGNNFAINSGEIGDALTRSASSLSVAGNTLSESIGLITAGNTVVQDADAVGTALKTVSLRITSTSTELEEMGEDTEYACETLSDYKDLVMGLTNNRVNIVGDNGEYKSTYQILKDISEVWEDMNSMEQSALMKALFGARQANIGASILENFDIAEQAMKTAENSAGSALKEQEAYEKGIQYSLDRLSASYEEFSNHILDSSFIKSIVDFGNTAINVLDGITTSLGSLGTLGVGAGLIASFKNIGVFRTFDSDLDGWTSKIGIFGKSFKDLGVAINNAFKASIDNIDNLNEKVGFFKSLKNELFPSNKAKSIIVPELIDENTFDFDGLINGLNEVDKKVKAGDITWQEYSDSLSEGDKWIANFGQSTEGTIRTQQQLIDANKAANASAIKFNQTLEQGSLKAKLMSIGLGVLKAAANMLIAYGISQLISGMSELAKMSDTVAESAHDLGESFSQSLNDLNDYKEKIQELHDTIADGSSSMEEVSEARRELLSIQNEMIDTYGNEESAINLVTDAIDNQTSAFEKLAKIKWQETLNEFNDSGFWNNVGNFLSEYDDNIDRMLSEFEGYSATFNLSSMIGTEDYDKLRKVLEEAYGAEFINQGNGAFVKLSGTATEVYNKILEIQGLSGEFKFSDRLNNKLTSLAETAKKTSSQYDDFYNQYVLYERIFANDAFADSYKAINDAYKEYENAFASGNSDAITTASNNFSKILSEATNNVDDSSVVDYFNNMYPDLQATVSEWRFETSFKANTDSLKTDVYAALKGLEGLSSEDILGFNESVATNDQINGYNKLREVAKEYGMEISELISLLEEMELIQSKSYQELVEKFGKGLVDSIAKEDLQIAASVALDFDGDVSNWDEFIKQIDMFKYLGENAISSTKDILNNLNLSVNDLFLKGISSKDIKMGNYDSSYTELIDGADSYIEKVNELQIALGKINDGKLTKGDLDDLMKMFPEWEFDTDNLTGSITDLIQNMNTDMVDKFADQFGNIDSSDDREAIEKFMHAVLELGYTVGNTTFSLNIDTEREGIEKVTAALQESVSSTGLTSESITNLKNRYAELLEEYPDLIGKGYDLNDLFEETANGIHLNRDAVNELENAYEKYHMQDIENEINRLTGDYNLLTHEINNTSDAAELSNLYAQRDDIIDQINDLGTLAAQYDGLTSAYHNWENVSSAGNERDMYEGIISGKEEMEEEMKRGWFDDGTIAFLELLSGKTLSTEPFSEQKKAYQELYDTIGKSKYNVWDFFTTDDDGNSTSNGVFNFFDTVKAVVGETAAWVDENGKYHFDFSTVDGGDAAIAEVLGISEELVQIILRAADDAGFTVHMESAYTELADFENEVASFNDRLKELKATEYTFNINSTDVEYLDEQLVEAQKAYAFLQSDECDVKVSDEELQNAKLLIASIVRQMQSLEEKPTVMSVKIDEESADSNIEKSVLAMQNFINDNYDLEVKLKTGDNTDDVKEEIQTSIQSLKEMDPTISAKLGFKDDKEFQEALNAVDAAIEANIDIPQDSLDAIKDKIGTVSPEMMVEAGLSEESVAELLVDVAATEEEAKGKVTWDNDRTKIDEFISENHTANGTVYWEDNTSKLTRTYTGKGVIYWETESTGTAHVDGTAKNMWQNYRASIGAYAKGSDWALPRNEKALVNEIGTESIVRDGKWFPIPGGAHVEQLKAGDIIFSAAQTDELLRTGRITSGGGHGRIAHANGTAYNMLNAYDIGSTGDGVGRVEVSTTISKNSSGNKNKSSSSSSSDSAKEFSETLDWIERKIQDIERDIDNLDKTASATYKSWSERNSALSKEISLVNDEIDIQQDAYNRYMQEANSVGLSDSYKKLVQDGKIDIQTITDETLAEQIKEYQEWHDKAIECQDAVQDLQDQLAELAKTRFDGVVQQFENIVSATEHSISLIEGSIDKIETEGYLVSARMYEELKKEQEQKLATLSQEYTDLQSALATALAEGNIEKYSDDWYELVGNIQEVESEIQEINTDLAETNNLIRETSWNIFDKMQEMLGSVQKESNWLIDLMSNDKMFNEDDASITNQGQAILGLHAVNYNAYMSQANDFANEIKKIDADLAKDENKYNTTLLNRREELLEQQRDMISSAKEEEQAMKDLISEGYDTFLGVMDKAIDKRKELLNTTKD